MQFSARKQKHKRSGNFISAQRCEIFIREKCIVNSVIKTFHCKCAIFIIRILY